MMLMSRGAREVGLNDDSLDRAFELWQLVSLRRED